MKQWWLKFPTLFTHQIIDADNFENINEKFKKAKLIISKTPTPRHITFKLQKIKHKQRMDTCICTAKSLEVKQHGLPHLSLRGYRSFFLWILSHRNFNQVHKPCHSTVMEAWALTIMAWTWVLAVVMRAPTAWPMTLFML